MELFASENFIRLWISALSTVAEYLLAAFIFAIPMRRKALFFVRLLVCAAGYVASAFLIALWRTFDGSVWSRIVTTMWDYLLPLPLLLFCFAETVPVVTIHWCAGIAAGEAGVWIINLFLTAIGVDIYTSITIFQNLPKDPLRDWILYYALFLIVYLLLFLLFGRSKFEYSDPKQTKNIALFAFLCVLVMSISVSLSREYRTNSAALFTISMAHNLIVCLLLLVLRGGLLFRSRARHEMELMEQVLREERKQYESVKESMDIINMKCHDLKHQLSDMSGRLTEQETAALSDAIAIYDGNIKTGSEVLDVLLYEKQLVCQKEKIQLSCMANGALLGFMKTAHVYVLFNNAIGNAIEAVRRLGDPEKRVISISVTGEGSDAVIEIANYFDGRVLPTGEDTSKVNRNQHGFGLKSMRYIVSQYGGTMEAGSDGDLYVVLIRFLNRRS